MGFLETDGLAGDGSGGELTTEERRRKLTGLAVHGMGLAWAFLLVLVFYLFGPEDHFLRFLPTLSVAGVALLAAEILLFLGRIRAASWTLILPMVPVLTASMWLSGGVVRGGGVFTFTAVSIAAALLGRRGAKTMALLCLLSVTFVTWADFQGILPKAQIEIPPTLMWAQLVAALVVSVLVLDGLVRSLHRALTEAEVASRRQAEVESRYVSAQKLEPVGQLASGVAHDFNNLLSVMTSVSASLRAHHDGDSDPGESPQELLDDLDEATARASLMTGQLLSFSRRRVFEVDSIDLDELLESVSPLLNRLLGDEIAVAFRGTTDGLSVEADRGQVEQIVLNLAVNARDAMPKGGTLSITVGQDSEQDCGVFLEVSDTGVGMAKEVADQIFTPFFTTKPEGTGLGLATVHDIVARLCGTVEVKSTVGKGTTFRIELPATPSPATSLRPSVSRQRIATRAARLLLVEDHELLRRATQRSLEHVGYAVTSVVNGQEALALIQGGGIFDVLVTDISMPKMGGVELALQLEKQNLSLPIVFMSGNTGRLPKEVENLAIVPRFLAKPFAQSDFLAAVDKSVSQGRVVRRTVTKRDGVA